MATDSAITMATDAPASSSRLLQAALVTSVTARIADLLRVQFTNHKAVG